MTMPENVHRFAVEGNLQEMLERKKIGIWYFDMNSRQLWLYGARVGDYVGDRIHATMIENAPQSLFDENIVDIGSRDELQKMFDDIEGGIEGGIEHSGCIIKLLDGNQFYWVHVAYTLLFDDTGVPIAAMGTLQTTSARKDIELLFVRLRVQTAHMREGALSVYEINLTQNLVARVESTEHDTFNPTDHRQKYTDLYENGFSALTGKGELKDQAIGRFEHSAMMRAYEMGKRDIRVEFEGCRIRGGEVQQESGWISATAFLQRAKISGDLCAVIYINDIDPRRRAELELKLKAERDGLTELYNRGAVTGKIQQALTKSGGNLCAMFMIDIDNFKGINDTFGHVYGDAVLSEMAGSLFRIFRRSDLIGRMGGDEFIVFLEGIPSEQFAYRKAEQICQEFRNVHSATSIKYEVSSSVGLAFAPRDGMTFEELYHKSDIALYHAKEHGKDKYSVYHDGLDKSDPLLRGPTGIEHYLSKNFTENMAEYVFKILYHSDNLRFAVSSVLQLFAKHYNTQHAYIYALDAETDLYKVVYEWFEPGVDHSLEGTAWAKAMSEDELCAYLNRFNGEGLLFVEDTLAIGAQDYIIYSGDARSFVQSAIKSKDGKSFGFIAMEEYRDIRKFTKDELGVLRSATEIIGTFMLAKANERRRIRQASTLQAVMDGVQNAIYVIDPDDYRIVFANKALEMVCPHIKHGDFCYRAIVGRDQPCDVCVVRDLDRKEKSSRSKREYIYGEDRRWVSTEGTWIEWPDGNEYALVNSIDITQYKSSFAL